MTVTLWKGFFREAQFLNGVSLGLEGPFFRSPLFLAKGCGRPQPVRVAFLLSPVSQVKSYTHLPSHGPLMTALWGDRGSSSITLMKKLSSVKHASFLHIPTAPFKCPSHRTCPELFWLSLSLSSLRQRVVSCLPHFAHWSQLTKFMLNEFLVENKTTQGVSRILEQLVLGSNSVHK